MSSLSDALTERQRLVEEGNWPPKKTKRKKSEMPYTPDNDPNLLSRDEIGRLLAHPELRVGIDRLAVSFPVRSIYKATFDHWGSTWVHATTQKTRVSTQIPQGQGSARFSVNPVSTGLTGYLEFNPSTILYGKKSCQIARLDQTLEILQNFLEEIDLLVDRPIPASEFKVSRLDISVDIPNAMNIQGVLDHAGRHSCTSRKKTNSWRSKKGLESVACRSKSSDGWLLYDKSLQAGLPGSVLRCEVVIRRRKMKHYHCNTIGDLSESVCLAAFQTITQNLSSGLQNLARGTIDEILSSPTETEILVYLIGLEMLNRHGYFPSVTNHRRLSKLEPFKSKYGYTTYEDLLG